MKQTFFYFLILIGMSLKSQNLVLTQSFNQPTVGDTNLVYPMDTLGFSSAMPIGLIGNNITWDFTKLNAKPNILETAYISPTTVTNSASFSGCNIVEKQGGLYTFLKSSITPTTQTELLGLTSSTLSFNFTNTAIAAKYPMAFGTSISDNFSGTFVFSLNGTCSGTLTSNADGYGTIKLPNNLTLTNVLRVKSVQTLNLSAALITGLPPSQVGTIKQTYYNYFHASQKFPVLSINYTRISLITSQTPTVTALITGNSKSIVVGLTNHIMDENSLNFYPNPSIGILNIEIKNNPSKNNSLFIYDITGKIVKQLSFENSSTSLENINLKDLNPGVYFLKLKLGEKILSKKIILE